MSYRAWPAALLSAGSLIAASIVVGSHVADADDGCLRAGVLVTARTFAPEAAKPSEPTDGFVDPAGPADPVDPADSADPGRGGSVSKPNEAQVGASDAELGEIEFDLDSAPKPAGPEEVAVTGCLELDRVEIPAESPTTADQPSEQVPAPAAG